MLEHDSALPKGCERVDVGELVLNVRITGSGTDTVYLLHGVTANLHVWEPVARELSRAFRVVAVDQRGHGHSDKPDTGYGATGFSDDVIGLVTVLQAGGRNLLVGHSLGARNSAVATARRPDLIDGFVGIEFTPFIENEIFDVLEARVGGGDRSFETVAKIESYLTARYPLMPADAIARRASYGYEHVGDNYRPLASAHGMLQTVSQLREDLGSFVTRLKRPGVFVRGAESLLVTANAFAATQRLRPDLGYSTVQHADHYVPEEQPAAVVDIVRSFAESLSDR